MESKRVIVTYSDENGNWANIAEDLAARLPLRGLVWKPSNGRATRNIAMLDVELKRFSPESSKNLPPVTLLQNPYLNLYFVNCEDNESYKNTVRQQIREWINLVTSKKNQEWLIVHVNSQEVSRNAAKFLMRSSVLDKIKADFNTGKKDRVAQLRMADTEMSEMELWADFTAKMKDGIITSFDQNVMTFEEDIRRLDSQRQMPGWNYCTFFILKEGLTHAYEMMNLHEEALRQYDELEASFFQILRDNALTWYGKFGGMQEGDDDANLLDLNRKPYRDLIMQNTISVFDFRTYLFGRQCHLLFRLRRPVEICHRALIFIPSFARTVREHVLNLTENFLESWIYSACMCIVNECDETVPLANDDPHMMVLLDGAKAELLQLARQQLDKLGIQHGRLPKELPFTMSLGYDNSTEAENAEELERKPMSKDLLEAVSTNETFDTLYMSVSARAIKGYDNSGRHRSSLLLHGDVAALQYHRQKYSEASRILESITWRYGHNHWTVLENELVIKHAKCLRELGDTPKYAQACLSLLRNMDDLKEEDLLFYSNELFSTVTAKELKQELYHEFQPMFSVKVVSVVDILQDDDGSYMDIMIENKLPKDVEFNKLSVRMVSGETDELWFNIRHGVIKPGKNTYRVSCETSASGTYVLEKVHLKTGKLIFLYDFLQESRKRIFRVDSHPQALKATIKTPTSMTLGQPSTFVVHVSSGRNQVVEATLSLFRASDSISLLNVSTLSYTKTALNESAEAKLTSGEIALTHHEAIMLPAFGPNETIAITVPYETHVSAHEHLIKLVVQYLTPNTRRHTFTLTTEIDAMLPLQVSHSFIWRDECLNLKLSMTCTGYVPIRIFNVDLQHPAYIKNRKQPPFAGEMVLFPRQNASFVFKISRGEDSKEDEAQAKFVVHYHSLRDEVEKALTTIVEADLEKAQLSQHASFVSSHMRSQLLRGVDYMAYGMSDELELPLLDTASCEAIFAYHDPKIRETLIDILKDLFSANKRLDYDQVLALVDANVPVQVAFPIHLPTSQMLTTVEIVVDDAQTLTVGTPATFKLVVKHSSYWSPNKDHEKTCDFYYDILVDYENWLLCGHKKRLFTAKQMDDFEGFEFIDYTTSGPWEKFIIQIEDCLKKWGLVHNSYGVFDTSSSGHENDNRSKIAVDDQSSSDHELYHCKEIVTLEGASYLLSYQYHPAKARIMAGVQGINLEFLPTTLEGYQHHVLHRWTALAHILVLAPITAADMIVDLGSAKLLLSSFAIAFQNTGCNIPVFVPTGQPRNQTYTGLSIHPQLTVSQSELGLEESEEDQAIEVRFNTVLVPYPPAQYTNLSGILDLFIERMGIEDEFVDQHHQDHSDEEGEPGYSQTVKEQILVSGFFTYPLDNWYDEDWRKLPAEEASSYQGPELHAATRLPFGPVQDPLKSLQLVARFASAPSTVYLNNKDMADMDASQANVWNLLAIFKSDDYGILSGILEDAIASWAMETSSATSSNMAGPGEPGTGKSRSYGSLLRKGARLIQGSIAMVDVDDVNSIVHSLFHLRSKASIEQQKETTAATATDSQCRTESINNDRVISAKELSLHFRHATIVPCNSFLWKMQQYLVDIISPESGISYPTTFMGFMNAVWAEAVKEFAHHWEQKKLLPLVDISDYDPQELSAENDDNLALSAKKSQPSIDLRFNLLHQKLAMLNHCIAREKDLTAASPTTTLTNSSPSNSIASSSSKNTSQHPMPTLDISRRDQTTDDDDSDDRRASSISLNSQEQSLKQMSCELDAMVVSDAASATMESLSSVVKSETENLHEAEGRSEQLQDLLLLQTNTPLFVPRLQVAFMRAHALALSYDRTNTNAPFVYDDIHTSPLR
ncbi:hypothetical protein BG004_001467 [Podila humilis]|nr:hypothetical protein BG004_001467 [Podila humilis]